jgi:VanZ family protein
MFFGAVALYVAAIFVLSHFSGSFFHNLSVKIWDKLIHAAEYLPVGFLLTGWLANWKRPPRGRVVFVVVVLVMVLVLGALDETHQFFVPGRTASVGDLLADVVGGTLGAIIGLGVFSRWRF